MKKVCFELKKWYLVTFDEEDEPLRCQLDMIDRGFLIFLCEDKRIISRPTSIFSAEAL